MMESYLFETDLHTIDLFAYYLEHEVGTDRQAALNPTVEQNKVLRKIGTAVVAMVEKARADESDDYQTLADGYNGWRKRGINLNYFLTNHRDLFLFRHPDFRVYYVSEAKTILFEKKLPDVTGREFNIYLQIIGVIKN
ncbi:hypothetical protein [Dyadobacter sp. CY351]|uniref:hypothetical protein n=1 Tax=Dyadobacter sp. CY351 TaxID=2909337 RepID=UPI001F15F613|nr:hypothetical protein [Dyadobacter sp. CY351]MCF2518536.1 hypothetical protein [Dyadobacter sp. CY351]